MGACLRLRLRVVQVLGDGLDRDEIMAGKITPMFFGSAMNNFGVELFLRSFIDLAARPGGRCAGRSGARCPQPAGAGLPDPEQAWLERLGGGLGDLSGGRMPKPCRASASVDGLCLLPTVCS